MNIFLTMLYVLLKPHLPTSTTQITNGPELNGKRAESVFSGVPDTLPNGGREF